MKWLMLIVLIAGGAASQTVDYDAQGRVEFAGGQFRAAKASFEQGVRQLDGRPDFQAIVLTNLGMTLVALGEHASAERALRRAVVQRPESARGWQYLAQAMLRRGDRGEAERLIQKALSLVGSERQLEASCLSDLATVLIQGKRKREAAEMLDRAIVLSGHGQARARMLKNLGALKWELGMRDEAESLLGRSLLEMEAVVGREHPDVAEILEDYAAVLEKRGRKQEARQTAARAQSLRQAFGWQANTGRSTVDWRDIR